MSLRGTLPPGELLHATGKTLVRAGIGQVLALGGVPVVEPEA